MKVMKIFCDGGARGNPGPAAAAFVAYDSAGKLIHKASRFLGNATNNVAEYEALIMALDWLTENQKGAVEIILDSELVTKQMRGEYKIKNAALQVSAGRAKALEKNLAHKHIYRHMVRAGNTEADFLVNETLDQNL
ncbi:hypothetical protein A2803_00995 [Candidatus Woesebacteria bacterium RIFCSPHIGHO2_01_FULL_44_21]|uniref:RNase H type-1 domain-containing protein n=1 Tax=Candidatus Woesebacteria bacterium RIFCSPHIGHO2_01_FULL_44_21 TaxID=1802503 RepID=A0A1F7YXD5_9BACT|nr:MAG: hypothetical protein A2803_00995 [Candidatus Woesebacteria bacterium RIFCSPHIGHO2_01_FULL_44_21]OGM69710.1 MAG: hypothetical protein A2897_00185 [Candidatus Woesebacteria bacterium RIFCSPLOWO2_01_FULL_44_24b]